MTENRDYDALVHDINLGDITSSEHNANILRTLRDGNPCWNKTLYILEDEIEGDTDEFVVGAGDDLGWLGYFIGRSEVLEVLIFQYLPEEREQVDAFLRGVTRNQSIQDLSIQTDLGDQGFENYLGNFLRNNNALTSLRFVYFHVDTECAHNIAMALEQCRHNSLIRFALESSNDEDTFSEIAAALRTQSQLEELYLGRNNIGRDGCVALGNTLRRWQSSNLKCLDLSDNNIDDVGLEALVEGMTNCSNLEKVHLCDIPITAAGIRSMSPLLQSGSCSLKVLSLSRINFGDEGAIALADGLRGNKSLRELLFTPTSAGVTEVGWAAFSKLLCDPSSINNTYLSNHTLEWVGHFYDDSDTPPDIRQYIAWNKDERIDAAICKILTTHDHFDMKPFFQWKLKFLPLMIAWFKRARGNELEKSLESRKLSSMYDFVRGMPMLVQSKEKTRQRSRKRRLDGEAK